MKKVGIVCCSNGQKRANENDIKEAKLRGARERVVLELRRIRDYCLLLNEEKCIFFKETRASV